MKIQHLAIIFVVIILPISIVLSEYTSAQINTIRLQTSYTNSLTAATYDMMKSFQINTVNNRFSAISDSKIRDLQASINTFYNSMATSMATHGMTRATLQEYTPVILCSLYDGYYIYSKYNNEVTVIKNDENNTTDEVSQYGLKPYIYYSCRYVTLDSDFVVNYTLDNAITVYGKVKGDFVTKTGYLINLDTDIFSQVGMDEEILSETILTTDDGVNLLKKAYTYVVYDNDKVYYDPDESGPAGTSRFFWYRENKKNYISDQETIDYANSRLRNNQLVSESARQYYDEAVEFTNWVKDNLGDIEEKHARNADGSVLELETTLGDGVKIFRVGDQNDPMKEGSSFNEHRLAVIRNSIQTNLLAAIANYNDYSNVNYEFGLPVFTETDWDKILHNICFVSFLQGLPIGAKYYNDYVVITNDKNKEFVSEDAIYIIDGNGNYHQPGCQALLEGTLEAGSYDHLQGYSNISFVMQNLTVSEDDIHHFYLQDNTYGCYECVVNARYLYDLDDLIAGTLTPPDGHHLDQNCVNAVRKAYLTALARERYTLYKTNGYFGTN